MRGAPDSATVQPRHSPPMGLSLDMNGVATTVVEPDAILPEQFFAAPSPSSQSRGEYALMRAVLEEAVGCIENQFVSPHQRALQLAREAEEWVRSHETRWPFAFVNVCAALGLDADYVRRQLALRRQGATRPLRRSRRRVMAAQARLSLAA
jgi:hypothetical protein